MTLSAANLNPNRLLAVSLILIALLVGAGLRFTALEERPMHVDEAATGAQTLANYLETGNYAFNPHHYHGPMLPFLAAKWCLINGQRNWLDLEAKTLRQVTAACGLLTLAGILLLNLGLWRSAVGMAILGSSPLLVYYSRMYIHEPVFLLCAMPALAGMLMVLRGESKWLAACLLGIGIGLMAGTRETVVISVAAWGVAGLLALGRDRGAFLKVQGELHWPFFAAVGLSLLIIIFNYSMGGQGLGGVVVFFKTYFVYEPIAGHEKPFLYYLNMLVWPKLSAGRWWTEGGILILAALVYLGKPQDRCYLAGRFLFEAGVLHLLIFSLIAYKTPWLASLGWMQLCLAAAVGWVALWDRLTGRFRVIAIGLLVVLLGWQGIQSQRAAFRLSADGRNPYAYVPTVTDVVGLPAFLNELQANIPGTSEFPLAVVGESYWPLPWYLRQSGEVGYYGKLPDGAEDFPVVILMPSAFETGSEFLESSHIFIPRGLRNEFPIIIAVENGVWSRYQEQP